MKIWVDDVRPAPDGYIWCKSVNEAKRAIWYVDWSQRSDRFREMFPNTIMTDQIDLIDMDHDAGEYAEAGGDYIELLEWFEETGRSYPIHIHSMNPVGVENMRRIIQRNGWTEVK